jgi:hypothetical protein
LPLPALVAAAPLEWRLRGSLPATLRDHPPPRAVAPI